ncbi:MAG: DUF421 domain-containing protein [Bacteriovorax sp.]|nr:DUF421 domain-containing protein [Bacteriovorax sp.]
MWHLNSPWYNLVFRAFVIYLFVFFVIRLIGKKQLSKLSSFDFALILIMSLSIQNGVMEGDHSIPAVLIVIGALAAFNYIMNELTYRFNWFEKLIIGIPEVVILNGKVHKRILKKEKISEAELFEALREHEVMKTEDVKCAILETDGKISVIKYGPTH